MKFFTHKKAVGFLGGVSLLLLAGTAQSSVNCSISASPGSCTAIYSSILTLYLDRGGIYKPVPENQVLVTFAEAEPELGESEDCQESPSGLWHLYMPYSTDIQQALYSTLLSAKAMEIPVVVVFDSASCEISTVSFGDSPF